MNNQKLTEHKNTLESKVNEINRTIEYLKSIEVTNLISTLENTRDQLSQLIYIIDTELYKKEKEPLYEVIIGDLYLIKRFNDRNDFYFDNSTYLCTWEKSAYQLTEAEIKSIDERYWSFAVPVEKEETE